MNTLTHEVGRRRTFATNSHPDAAGTNLTEKLLLFGGAIQLPGAVKAQGERRRVPSDWMAVDTAIMVLAAAKYSNRASKSRPGSSSGCAGYVMS